MNTLNKIQQVVSDRIRPALQGHGGDMTITSFSNGILSNVPEVKDVQMEFAVSDELIDMAKKLLNHET